MQTQTAARWGGRVIAADGSLDRAALRRIVFAHAPDRVALDAIMHPAIKARRDILLAEVRALGERAVVCEIPLLFEAGLAADVDVVLLVDAPRDVRLERLVRDRGLRAAEALAMVDAQLPAESKRARSGYVIDNDGTIDTLRSRVESTWRAIERDHLP